MKRSGSSSASWRRKTARSSRSAGTYKRSASPPARQLTWRAIGSSRRSSPRRFGRRAARPCSLRLRELRRHAADGARAHGDHHVAGLDDAADRARHLGDVLDEDRLDLAGEAQRARAIGRPRRRSALRPRRRLRRAAARRRSRARARSPRKVARARMRWGWKASTMRRPGKAPRAASIVAAISAGW